MSFLLPVTDIDGTETHLEVRHADTLEEALQAWEEDLWRNQFVLGLRLRNES